MKKSLLTLVVPALLCVVAFTGCTTIESTQKFNRMGLGTPNEKAICQTYVELSGLYIFGLPIVVGSPAGNGEWTVFRNNLTAENAVFLLTKEAKMLKAARVINVQVNKTDSFLFFGVSRRTVQASGTGVRTRGAAMENAAREYDSQP